MFDPSVPRRGIVQETEGTEIANGCNIDDCSRRDFVASRFRWPIHRRVSRCNAENCGRREHFNLVVGHTRDTSMRKEKRGEKRDELSRRLTNRWQKEKVLCVHARTQWRFSLTRPFNDGNERLATGFVTTPDARLGYRCYTAFTLTQCFIRYRRTKFSTTVSVTYRRIADIHSTGLETSD